MGSGGGTTEPGRVVRGSESLVSILRGLRAGNAGSTGRMCFHSTTRSAGTGRPPLRLNPPSAPKTGTPPRSRDDWFTT